MVFDGTISTDPILTLAEIVKIPTTVGTHTISVFVNDQARADTTFDVRDVVYVGVDYEVRAEDKIGFTVRNEPFTYR